MGLSVIYQNFKQNHCFFFFYWSITVIYPNINPSKTKQLIKYLNARLKKTKKILMPCDKDIKLIYSKCSANLVGRFCFVSCMIDASFSPLFYFLILRRTFFSRKDKTGCFLFYFLHDASFTPLFNTSSNGVSR